ncbi:MAG: ABC transporter permease, partial [Chloroflexota bacterium]
MDNIFGIPMNTILIILVAIMAICFVTVALIAVFNPIIFKMALRNPPRRKAQTVLIIVGLMLATLIVSAALTTGDTLDHSIKKTTYDSLGEADITVGYVGDAGGQSTLSPSRQPVPLSLADDLEAEFGDDPDIENIMPMLTADVPAINQEEQLSEPSAILTGVEWDEVAEIGGINAPDGSAIDLDSIPDDQAVISETLATDTRTEVGDQIDIFVDNQPYEVTVAAIGQDSLFTGLEFGNEGPASHGLAMSLDSVQEITGLEDQARFIVFSLTGGAETDLGTSERVEADLESALEGTEYGINPVKREAVESAELAGSQFVSLFLVLGLFSIAAGVLLIFLIFMMLAAERRPEMGMARAVGMRQSSLVQQFISE